MNPVAIARTGILPRRPACAVQSMDDDNAANVLGAFCFGMVRERVN
jgi:hypothetical protein